MNLKSLAKQYCFLGPEERFRLILAAGARGDETEQARLIRSAGRLDVSVQDHFPQAMAFNELAQSTFLALLEEAQRYVETFDWAGDADDEEPDDDDQQVTPSERRLNLAMSAGFLLKTNVAGWKLFCERSNVPPFILWELLPGYERLQRAVALAEQAAFTPGGFLRWMNSIRPVDSPELVTIPYSAQRTADDLETGFRRLVAWFQGA